MEARQARARGHRRALPPLPEGASLPSEMKIEHGNDQEMSDGERHVHPEGSM